MLDIKLIRDNPEIVKKNLLKRGEQEKIEMLNNLIDYDIKWRKMLAEANKLRHERKIITSEISKLKKQGKNATEKIKKAKKIPLKIKDLETKVAEYRDNADLILMKLPNILHDSVPFG